MGKSIDNSLRGDTEHEDSSVLEHNSKPGFFSDFKHYMNPLHIYCRERDIGIPKGLAMFLSRIYERTLYNLIFNNHKKNLINF